jgi:hypothetical protein
MGDGPHRVRLLSVFAPMVPSAQRTEAFLNAFARLELAAERSSSVAELFGSFPQAVLTIDQGWPPARPIAELAAYVPLNLLAHAVQRAAAFRNDGQRARLLTALAAHIPPALHDEALAAAEQSTDPWWRIQALAGLFPHLDHERREAAEQQAHACADRAVLATIVAGLIWPR